MFSGGFREPGVSVFTFLLVPSHVIEIPQSSPQDGSISMLFPFVWKVLRDLSISTPLSRILEVGDGSRTSFSIDGTSDVTHVAVSDLVLHVQQLHPCQHQPD